MTETHSSLGREFGREWTQITAENTIFRRIVRNVGSVTRALFSVFSLKRNAPIEAHKCGRQRRAVSPLDDRTGRSRRGRQRPLAGGDQGNGCPQGRPGTLPAPDCPRSIPAPRTPRLSPTLPGLPPAAPPSPLVGINRLGNYVISR